MLRTALLFLCLLGATASVALASPAAAQHTPAGLRSHRLMRGNFEPVYKTYRYHSHPDRPLFSFLHFGGNRPAAAKYHHPRTAHTARRRTTGLF